MRPSVCLLLPLLASLTAPAAAQTIVTLGSGFANPSGVAVDSSGNIFVADLNVSQVKEILAGQADVGIAVLDGNFNLPEGVAVDSSGNVFVADTFNNAVEEFVASSGFATVKTIGTGFSLPGGVAVDGAGNVFVADTGNSAVKEILAAGGFATTNTIASGFRSPVGVAVDSAGNVFVADQDAGMIEEIPAGGTVPVSIGGGFNSPAGVAVDRSGNVFVAEQGANAVDEILASGGFTTVNPLGSGFNGPEAVAVDGSGNVFVADGGDRSIKEITALPPPILASVLPGSRSVQLGNPVTIFATIINAGAVALQNCQVALSGSPPAGLALSFQTTDPTTNALTGTPNTPVTIGPNNASQSFVISFQDKGAFDFPAMPLDFSCNGAPPAVSIEGVDTVDLSLSSTPTPDIVALALTATSNGIAQIPAGGTTAFALASTNLGTTAPITVSVDTGAASLPVLATICQTDPNSGQCLAPPAATASLNFTANLAPTFSVFLQAGAPIAFAPDSARIFVRFEDAQGGLHGSTSVAVQAD